MPGKTTPERSIGTEIQINSVLYLALRNDYFFSAIGVAG